VRLRSAVSALYKVENERQEDEIKRLRQEVSTARKETEEKEHSRQDLVDVYILSWEF
jgi:hypothetical protein